MFYINPFLVFERDELYGFPNACLCIGKAVQFCNWSNYINRLESGKGKQGVMYTTVLWDIDMTLLDFLAAEKYAIGECFRIFGLGVCSDEMLER